MKRRAPVITQDELAAAIDEARKDFGVSTSVRPRGALAIDEWCERLGLGTTAMRARMKKAVAQGLYERILVRSADACGRTYYVPVYRKVKNAVDRVR